MGSPSQHWTGLARFLSAISMVERSSADFHLLPIHLHAHPQGKHSGSCTNKHEPSSESHYILFFLLLPSRPRTSRVAERRATHQRPLESRKIPSKLRGGNLMGRTALKSMGQNPKPTGTFRPGAEGTKKSRNFTQTKRFEMSTVGCSGDLATATLENPRKKRTKSTHCTMQCWKLSD